MTTRPETIRLHIEHRRAWITLDRPPLNILNIAMMKSLALEHFARAPMLPITPPSVSAKCSPRFMPCFAAWPPPSA